MEEKTGDREFKNLVHIGEGFWNVRGSFQIIFGLVDIGLSVLQYENLLTLVTLHRNTHVCDSSSLRKIPRG